MAKLNHPNVITVHEVGNFAGQVFVAMEYVDGGTLRAKLGDKPRPWREILDDYVQAGRGLAAAHKAGLVHRDFKPENVLVGRDGRVRVTDFGLVGMVDDAGRGKAPPELREAVASESLPRSVGQSELTRTGSIMGTPAYMAPEQHAGEPVDARADQFAFCVALHEALYGVRPFAGDTYTALVGNVLAGTLVAPPADVEVPGWLRDVVLRGLSIDPAKRYPAMTALLGELAYEHRHRRRRTAVVATGFVALVGVAGFALLRGDDQARRCQGARAQLAGVWDPAIARTVAGTFAAADRPATAALGPKVDRAVNAYADGWAAMWKDACEATHVRGDQTGAVLDLRMRCLHRRRDDLAALVAVWTANPDRDTLDEAVKAAAELDPVEGCADLDGLAKAVPLPADPELRRRIEELEREVVAIRALRVAGQDRAGLVRARALVEATATVDYAPLRASSLQQLADLLSRAGDRDAAMVAYRDAATAASRAADDAAVAKDWISLAGIYLDQARYDLSDELLSLAAAAVVRSGDKVDLRRALALSIGTLRMRQGRLDEARASLDQAVTLHEQSLGRDNPLTAVALDDAAVVYMAMGDLERARTLETEALAIEEKAFGPDHPDLVQTLNNLAKTYDAADQPAEALPLMERAMAIAIATFGPDHPDVGVYHDNLGIVLGRLGETDQARTHHERAIAIAEKTQGPDHPDTARARLNLASLEKSVGNYARARELLERALASDERMFGPDNPVVATALGALANVLSKQGEHALARERYQRAIAIQEKVLGAEHPELAGTINDYGTELESDGKLAEAAAQYQRAAAIWEKSLGPDNNWMSTVLTNLGSVANKQHRYQDATAYCKRVNALDVAALGADNPDVAYSLTCLGTAALGEGRAKDAVALLEQALTLRAGKTSPDAEAETRFALARALWASPKHRARAHELAEKARAQFDQSGAGFTAPRDEIAAWLKLHPAP